MRKLRRFLETDSLYPPQAALRLFPPCEAHSFSARRKRMGVAFRVAKRRRFLPPAGGGS
jgi:hypothetical protein